MTDEVIIDLGPNGRGETVRVQLHQFKGHQLIDIRKYFTAADGTLAPTSKGISIAVRHLPELAKAIEAALRRARDHRLIEADDGR